MIDERLSAELVVEGPPQKKRKLSCLQSSADPSSDDELPSESGTTENFTSADIEDISELVGKRLRSQERWTNPVMRNAMKKFENVARPLPVPDNQKVKIGKFTKFVKGGNLLFWLTVIREEFVACNVSNERAYLFIPQLIEDIHLSRWAEHMIGTKELHWPDVVKMLALKSNDFAESSKALRRLETIEWHQEESAANFAKRFIETYECTQLDQCNPNLILEYLQRAMQTFHAHEILFVNKLVTTLPEDWDLFTFGTMFIEMMPVQVGRTRERRYQNKSFDHKIQINSQSSKETSKAFCHYCMEKTSKKYTNHLERIGERFIIATDASDRGIGAVLYQMKDNEKRIISIVSKALSPTQQRYAITKKELFAVVYALNKFNNYVYGRKFLLQTDHQSLLSIFNGKRENKVLNNWLYLVISSSYRLRELCLNFLFEFV